MHIWSSPFPCTANSRDLLHQANYEQADFPGPRGSLVLYDTPDQVLLAWGRLGRCDGAELSRLNDGYKAVQQLDQTGDYVVMADWQLECYLGGAEKPIPTPDAITGTLLLQHLLHAPDCLSHYENLDPFYWQRLHKIQHNPAQVLTTWLQSKNKDNDLERPATNATEIDRERRRIESLLDQVTHQHRRVRQLLSEVLHDKIQASSQEL